MADKSVVWIMLSLYFACLLGLLGFIAHRKRKPETVDSVGSHYLASRSLNGVALTLTTIASVFSGYTVTGLPAEAYMTGFSYMRWIGIAPPIVLMFIVLAPRLRWLSEARGYVSVLDVVRDRYIKGPVFPKPGCDVVGSVLHWAATFTFLVPCMIYLLVQFISFESNIAALSEGAISKHVSGLVLFFILSAFEVVGGLQAVVLTDMIQGTVLSVAVVSVILIQATMWGGLEKASLTLEAEKPSFLAAPADSSTIGGWLNFWVTVGASRVLFPDLLTRMAAAGTQQHLRATATTLFFVTVGIFVLIGIIGIQGYARLGPGVPANHVFSRVCLDVVDSSWLGAIFGSLLMAASTAAIMSTADSVLMEVAKLVAFDIYKPISEAVWKQSSDKSMLRVGRAMTFLVCALCYVLTATETLTLDHLSDGLSLQGIFGVALAPTFIYGLYSDAIRTWMAALSILFGVGGGVSAWILKVNASTVVGEPQPILPTIVLLINMLAVGGCVLLETHWRPGKFWEQWQKQLDERDALEKDVPEKKTSEQADCSREHFEAVYQVQLPRPAIHTSIPGAPAREPIHQWQILAGVLMAIVLALPWGGGGEGRTSGMPDWCIILIMRILGIGLVLVALVYYSWSGAPAGQEGPSSSVGAAPEDDRAPSGEVDVHDVVLMGLSREVAHVDAAVDMGSPLTNGESAGRGHAGKLREHDGGNPV